MAKDLMVNRRDLFGNGVERTAMEFIHCKRGATASYGRSKGFMSFCQAEAGEKNSLDDVFFST